jgi:hypothetical protein
MEKEYTDHLKEHLRGRAKRLVDDMGEHYPPELVELKNSAPDRLIELIADKAAGRMRMMEDAFISEACFDLTNMISWAKAHPKEGK